LLDPTSAGHPDGSNPKDRIMDEIETRDSITSVGRNAGRTKRSTVALAAVVSAIAMPALAETTICTQISTIPYTITAPGVYCLDADFTLAMNSGAAITISASNVTLDMNRHVTAAYGVTANQQKNIVVKNGSVQGFSIGVAIFDTAPYTISQGNVIEGIAAASNTFVGLMIEGQSSIVERNLVTETGGPNGSTGIYVAGPDNVVRDNDVSASGTLVIPASNGIGADATHGLVVDDNRVTFGLFFPKFSNSFTGISVSQSSNVIIRNTAIVKIDSGGATPYRSNGIYTGSVANALVVSNHIAGMYNGVVSMGSTAVETTGNAIVGATIPVYGTTPATTY
jgi:hypothetical protein